MKNRSGHDISHAKKKALESGAYYDEIASGYQELHNEEQIKKLDEIIDWLKQRNMAASHEQPHKVLDVGCGSGINTKHIQSRHLWWDVTGIDPSEKLLARCPYETFVGMAEDLQFEDNSFDGVISLTALHHVDDPKIAIDEIFRVGRTWWALSILHSSENFKHLENEIKLQSLERNLNVEIRETGPDVIFILH